MSTIAFTDEEMENWMAKNLEIRFEIEKFKEYADYEDIGMTRFDAVLYFTPFPEPALAWLRNKAHVNRPCQGKKNKKQIYRRDAGIFIVPWYKAKRVCGQCGIRERKWYHVPMRMTQIIKSTPQVLNRESIGGVAHIYQNEETYVPSGFTTTRQRLLKPARIRLTEETARNGKFRIRAFFNIESIQAPAYVYNYHMKEQLGVGYEPFNCKLNSMMLTTSLKHRQFGFAMCTGKYTGKISDILNAGELYAYESVKVSNKIRIYELNAEDDYISYYKS